MQSHTPEEIAQVIAPQFPETDLDTLTIIVTRYYEQDTWKDNLVFEQDSFELLQDILESAGELSERVDYEQLVATEFAESADKITQFQTHSIYTEMGTDMFSRVKHTVFISVFYILSAQTATLPLYFLL